MPTELCEQARPTMEEPGGATRIQPAEMSNQAKTPSLPDTRTTATRNTAPTREWMHDVDAAYWQTASQEEEDVSTSATQTSPGWTSLDTTTSPYSPSMRNIVSNPFGHQDHSTDDGSFSYHHTSSTRTALTWTPSSTSTPRRTLAAPTPYNKWALQVHGFLEPGTRSRSRRNARSTTNWWTHRSCRPIKRRNLLDEFDAAAKPTSDTPANSTTHTSPSAPWGRCPRGDCRRALQRRDLPDGLPALHCPRGHATAGQPKRHQTRT